jgi:hypothetical protein
VEISFKSEMWRQLPQEEKTRLIGRLSYILEITEEQELGDVRVAWSNGKRDHISWLRLATGSAALN